MEEEDVSKTSAPLSAPWTTCCFLRSGHAEGPMWGKEHVVCFRPADPTAHATGLADTVGTDRSWHLPSETVPPPGNLFSM